ncbi:MAG: methyltransferase domain-containing protein [Acetobacter sp.]|nr:methyltransferase domain-containing protein [Acetobacter sp.]
MSSTQENLYVFNRNTVRAHRDRAARTLHSVADLLEDLGQRLLDRLDDVNRSFTLALDLGGRGSIAPALQERGVNVISSDLSLRMAQKAGGQPVCADEEYLPFAPSSFDLVVASLSLHWANDLPGVLRQIRHVLKPDGLFLASIPVLPTLAPLRTALTETESALRDGVSARVSPFPMLRDCAGLMQRAGFALPVIDQEIVDLRYRSGLALIRDLRAAGETSALHLREPGIPPTALFPLTMAKLEENGDFAMPLHLAMISGWAPAASQPKPLKPGEFTTPLSDILDSLDKSQDQSD